MTTAFPRATGLDRSSRDLATDLATELRTWLGSGVPQSPSGAFYAWLDVANRVPAFEYPEITGYVLTYFAGLKNPVEREIAAARHAGRWLTERAGRGDLSARDGWDDGAVYNFDLAMIANGLLQASVRFDEPSFRAVGLELARRFREQIELTGELGPLPIGANSSRSAWSTDGRALMVKAAQCLLSAAELDPAGEFAAAAGVVVAMADKIQQVDGRIVTHPADHETMCHPHLYAVEGLWAYGQATGNTASLDRARAGALWVWAQQLDSGGLPRYVDTATHAVGPEQFDVTAQAIRAAVLTGIDVGDQVDRAVTRLSEQSIGEPVGRALPYQPHAASQHANVWVSMFAQQAAAVFADGAASVRWSELI